MTATKARCIVLMKSLEVVSHYQARSYQSIFIRRHTGTCVRSRYERSYAPRASNTKHAAAVDSSETYVG